MKLLRQYIREELITNFWLRRQKGSAMPALGDQIKKQREEVFDSASDDLETKIENLKHAIEVSNTIDEIIKAVKTASVAKISELALDPSLLSIAIKDKNLDQVKRLLLDGIKRWKDETLKWSKADDLDTTTLMGHPMRTPSLGGPSRGKR